MKRVYRRNTGRNIVRMSFIVDQKNSNKIEKVSQRQMISQSQLIRNLIEEGLRGWDCWKLDEQENSYFE